ncbi:MAG: J domain-containing protein [Eubacterium sp.]|nr:J domain-containing protein [Eubacterium sp.]
MRDPYKILGVSPDASDEEIKKAYRTLSRKYHPDANINNPHKEQAEEMFKIVQQAYQQIQDEREHGTGAGQNESNGGYGDFGSFGGFGGFGDYGSFGGYSRGNERSEENPRMQAAANYINSGHFTEAMHVLNDIPERSGEWYYLHAIANAGLGNNVEAQSDAKQAVELEPENEQFLLLHQRLASGGDWYSTMGQGYGYNMCGTGNASAASCCLGLAACMSCCCCPYGGFFCC